MQQYALKSFWIQFQSCTPALSENIDDAHEDGDLHNSIHWAATLSCHSVKKNWINPWGKLSA